MGWSTIGSVRPAIGVPPRSSNSRLVNDVSYGAHILTFDTASRTAAPTRLRPAERILLLYFGYTLVVAAVLGGDLWRVWTTAAAVAAIISAVSTLGKGRVGERVRDWVPLPLILVAYWQMDVIRLAASPIDFAHRWLPLDAWVLRAMHLGPSGWGAPASWLLETAYAGTYAIPPVAVGILYALGRHDRVDRFYTTFLAGTLVAYGLLPFFPSVSPRLIDPSAWSPPMTTMRQFNIWLLDHADIRTSVCPSGHVAAASSAALAMLVALPERKSIGAALFALASVIALATVYGRYHYAVDVMASIALSLAAWGAMAWATRGGHRGA
jgi:membrane-associated phospholipid phosphatase